jgi:hypothetical protein
MKASMPSWFQLVRRERTNVCLRRVAIDSCAVSQVELPVPAELGVNCDRL